MGGPETARLNEHIALDSSDTAGAIADFAAGTHHQLQIF